MGMLLSGDLLGKEGGAAIKVYLVKGGFLRQLDLCGSLQFIQYVCMYF